MKDTQLTRREVLGKGLQISAIATVFLSGCGGLLGGGGGSNALSSVTGQLALPAGLNPLNIQVVGAGGVGSITGNAFQVSIQSQLPCLVMVWDSVGQKLVFMGFLDAVGTGLKIDAESTAIAFMFLGLGGMALNAIDRRGLIDRIKTSAQLGTLTGVLQTQLASDPYAVTNSPQALKDAIANAVDGFSTGGIVASKGRDTNSLVAQPFAGSPQLLIEPGTEVDGMTFVQASDPLGFKVQNTRRRFGQVLTYVTGHVDANDVETAEDPPAINGTPLDIPTTVGLLNTSGTGWSQVTSKAMPLSNLGQDTKTKYEMIALTPIFGGSNPPVYLDTRYAGVVDSWKDQCGSLRQSVILAGFMELALEILGLGGAAMTYSTVQSAIAGLLTTTQVIRGAMTTAYLGNVFYGQVISEFASSMSFEEIFLAEMPLLETLTLKIKSDVAANTVRNAFLRPRLLVARAALVALIALGIIELADIFAIAKDTTSGNEANRWTGIVYKPTVSLTSSSATYKAGGQVTFSAHIPPSSSQLKYHWKASGSNLMVLDDGVTYDKLEFDSDNHLTTLSTTPSTVGDLTVSCEIFDVTDGRRVSLGKATKVIKLDPGNQNFTVDIATATRTFASGIVVTFKYIVVGIDVDETGATGLKITHPGTTWTFHGSAFTGHNTVVDIYHPQVDINGDLQINGTFGYFVGEQQNSRVARIGPNRAYFPGYWLPVNWRVQGANQGEVDAQLAALQPDIDALVAQIKSELQVQNLPGY